MIGVIFSIMTSALIASNGFFTAEARPQTPVFKIGRCCFAHFHTSGNTSIYYELNLAAIHNPTGAELVLGDVRENGVVVADLLQPDSSKTKDKKLGTLLTGSITETSLQGSMKGKSLSDLITAMRDGSTYVYIDTSKGEIREQIKSHGSASNPTADINLVLEEPSNDSKLPKLFQKGGVLQFQPKDNTSISSRNNNSNIE